LSSRPVAIAVGSNLGRRESHLEFAVTRLRELLDDVRVSRWLETAAVAEGPQPDYLNGAIVGRTSLSARALLSELLEVERQRGRERPYARAPRTLDLDLILYGEEVIEEPGLQVPHPRFRERAFVVEPLAEIAPEWRDPVTGRTIGELAAAVKGKRQP
jgi:2-amino-4-hydroxy-6-hydroxymethyldihydropteridine diphosphokinase